MIDLTRNSKPIEIKPVLVGNRLPVEAQGFLQEIKLNGVNLPIRCCILKDVDPDDHQNGIIPEGDYLDYRVAMLTLPKGAQYVNYKIENNKIVSIEKKHLSLPDDIHTLVMLNVDIKQLENDDNKDYIEQIFHICDDDKLLLGSPPYACAVNAVSKPISNKVNEKSFKPFHLFYLKNEKLDCFLIPLVFSQGTIIYYLIQNDASSAASLNAFIEKMSRIQNPKEEYWLIGSDDPNDLTKYIDYLDDHDIFITKIAPKLSTPRPRPE